MFALFELEAGWSVYYFHCTFCIALNLAPTLYDSNDRISRQSTINIKLIPYAKNKYVSKSFVFVL